MSPVTTEHAVAELTTTEAAVLALLMIEGEHAGYDLLKLVTKSIAHVSLPARSGLYAVLPRLERGVGDSGDGTAPTIATSRPSSAWSDSERAPDCPHAARAADGPALEPPAVAGLRSAVLPGCARLAR